MSESSIYDVVRKVQHVTTLFYVPRIQGYSEWAEINLDMSPVLLKPRALEEGTKWHHQ